MPWRSCYVQDSSGYHTQRVVLQFAVMSTVGGGRSNMQTTVSPPSSVPLECQPTKQMPLSNASRSLGNTAHIASTCVTFSWDGCSAQASVLTKGNYSKSYTLDLNLNCSVACDPTLPCFHKIHKTLDFCSTIWQTKRCVGVWKMCHHITHHMVLTSILATVCATSFIGQDLE